jgi:hypothetical protein
MSAASASEKPTAFRIVWMLTPKVVEVGTLPAHERTVAYGLIRLMRRWRTTIFGSRVRRRSGDDRVGQVEGLVRDTGWRFESSSAHAYKAPHNAGAACALRDPSRGQDPGHPARGRGHISHRYIADCYLPDKAIDLVDEACAVIPHRDRLDAAGTPCITRRVMRLESALTRFLSGSVSSKLAHHAPCSVLVVRER